MNNLEAEIDVNRRPRHHTQKNFEKYNKSISSCCIFTDVFVFLGKSTKIHQNTSNVPNCITVVQQIHELFCENTIIVSKNTKNV